MVRSIDLKPLSEESIAEMGYNNHDLWLVRLGSVVFGPFESESLKHYVHDNEHLFESAEASRADETEWKPFWSHTKFQRRKPQMVSGEKHEGPFWIMDFGLKVGPFTFREIDKKIEMGLLVMTDHVSVDDGQSWVKIYQIEGFDRRTLNPDELPVAPYESSFEKAKIALVEKMEQPHINTNDELAEMAWSAQQMGKVIQFKIEEMTLRKEKETHVSDATKWFIPAAAAIALTITTSAYFAFTSEDSPVVAEVSEEKPFYQTRVGGSKKRPTPSGRMPEPARIPASTNYRESVSPSYAESRYPTHIETHEDYPQEDPMPERDPLDGPVTDAEAQPEIHSLVGNENQPAQEQSLDQAMNGVAPDQPVIEEASDF